MADRGTIMIVDDNIANLKIGKNALMEQYDVFTAPSAKKMFELLERNKPDLILLDINMPEMDGFEIIKILKKNVSTQRIPTIFLTGKSDVESEMKGLTLGAVDYISKPFSPPILRKRVEIHLLVQSQQNTLREQREELRKFNESLQKLVDERTKQVLELQDAILKTMANLIESRDYITGGHIERIQFYLRIMVIGLLDSGLYADMTKGWNVDLLARSSQLHDIGKIAIEDKILQKPAALTSEEFAVIKQHPTLGVKIIEKMEREASVCDFLDYAKVFAGTHHERWDGKGYPNGLKGEDIPLLGRLLAIADVYDALTSQRSYKVPNSHENATQSIVKGGGTHFDPVLVDIFYRQSDKFREVQQTFKVNNWLATE
ncbi:MAG: response regulator [Treponema sp.]|jgi:putative two-component system response regulator|nr:response regulator [Treponema sp.]